MMDVIWTGSDGPGAVPLADGGFAECLRDGIRRARAALRTAESVEEDLADGAASRMEYLLKLAAEHGVPVPGRSGA